MYSALCDRSSGVAYKSRIDDTEGDPIIGDKIKSKKYY
jgi:hypothetical protein